MVADLSFISIMLALPAAMALATPGALLVSLIKPQFEAGADQVGKGGIVRDPAVHAAEHERIGCRRVPDDNTVDAEPLEHLNEIRISPVVVDDEPCVDRQLFAVNVDIDRVRVPADVIVGFENGDLVRLVQQPGSGQARDSGTNNGDLHP